MGQGARASCLCGGSFHVLLPPALSACLVFPAQRVREGGGKGLAHVSSGLGSLSVLDKIPLSSDLRFCHLLHLCFCSVTKSNPWTVAHICP